MLANCVQDTLGPDVNVEMPDAYKALCKHSPGWEIKYLVALSRVPFGGGR